MDINIIGPDTSQLPYFTLETTLAPEELTRASTALLNAVNARPKLTQAFRLEVKFLQNSAEFRVCLDPVAWYDSYLRVNPNLNEVVRIARNYVSTTRREIPPEEDGPFVIDHEEIEKDTAYIRCTKKHGSQSTCKLDHPELVCEGNVITRDGREATCDYYFVTKLIVQELSTENYVILLRREPIRELLMLPRPNKNKENYNHFDNETLVKNSDFWTDLLEQRRRLNCHSIALNYGRWETGQSRDKYAQACHSHVHLYFDSETWEGVKRMVTNREIKSKLNARNYPGPNYLLKDCMELEQQRLQSVEHQCVLASVNNIQNSLITEISSLNITINSFSNVMNTLNSTVNAFNSTVNTLNSTVNTLNENVVDLTKKMGKDDNRN